MRSAGAAERLADPIVLGKVLLPKVVVQAACLDVSAAIETGRRALGLLPLEALWDRADAMMIMEGMYVCFGRFAEADALPPELERVARRAGQHGALAGGEFHQRNIELMRTGDLRAATHLPNRATADAGRLGAPIFASWLAAIHLYLGQVDQAFERLTAVTTGQRRPAARGIAESNLFLGNALAGRLDHAQTLFPAVVPWLPAPERRNVFGAWWALEAAVAGLALVGHTERCGALYPSTLAYIDTGFVCAGGAIGPGTPQLAAAIAADAAGLDDKAREHFEIAARQARDLPFRILQPTVQYWFGRTLSWHADSVEQARGRAMIEAAVLDFRSLEMVLHADLAEQLLRDGR